MGALEVVSSRRRRSVPLGEESSVAEATPEESSWTDEPGRPPGEGGEWG
jgi:hypothetical protein